MTGSNGSSGGPDDRKNVGAEQRPIFNPKGAGANVFLTAAAAIVPLFIVGVAGLAKLTDRRGTKRSLRLPRR